MTDRVQNILRRRRPFASKATIVVGQFEPEITRANPNRVFNKRPRLIGSANSSRRLQRLIQHLQRRNLPSTPRNEEARLVLVEQVDSDSDSNSDPEGAQAVGVEEAQHQHQNVTASAPAPSPPGQATFSDAVADEAISVVFNDSKTLKCIVCRNPLLSPIFQCDNAHLACLSCQTKSLNKCPSCSVPKGFFHNRAMDNLFESMSVDCKNKKIGCTETFMYHEKCDHENTCPYTLCVCPISSCGFEATSHRLYDHFRKHHIATPFTYGAIFDLRVERSQKRVILQERNEGVIFILNHDDIQGHGRVLCLDVIGTGVIKRDFEYQLRVEYGDASVSLESVPEVCTKWKEHTTDKICVKIPSNFSELFIQVCIKKAPAHRVL